MAEIREEIARTEATTEDLKGPSLLDEIIQESGIVADDAAESRERAKELIYELADEVTKGMVIQRDVEATIQARIAQIDEMISKQLNEVMHAEPFQKLEATWRGLHHLVYESETGEKLKIRVLNATKKDVLKDLQKAAEFDQSNLFKMVYEAEYGTFGGAPYGLLVGDFDFSHHPQDVEFLEKISNVAAAAHAPFIAAAAPGMFNLKSFTALPKPRDLTKVFSSPEYIKWRSFRETEDSRYVALTLPRYLARLPWGKATMPAEGFNFEEDVDGTDHDKYLWANSAYLLASRITNAFSKYGWSTSIRGVEGGGLVEGLPTHSYQTDEGELVAKCPTEVGITDRRDKELSDLGFIALVHCKGTDYAAFFSGQTTNKPKKFVENFASANAELSARLPYLLAVSRFAHYLKAIVRDKVGGFESKATLQRYLERWIAQYVLLDDSASPAQKARKPLREAKIAVEEIPGQPGSYRAVAHLRPHFQLETMAVSLRLVAELPQSG